MSALQGVANFGEGRLGVQRLVLAMGEQEVALDVEGLHTDVVDDQTGAGTTTVMSLPLKTSTRVEASAGTP